MDDAASGHAFSGQASAGDSDRKLALAGWRLERALSRLETRLAETLRQAEAEAAALAAARSRARDLEFAAAAAADALDRALGQIRRLENREPPRD